MDYNKIQINNHHRILAFSSFLFLCVGLIIMAVLIDQTIGFTILTLIAAINTPLKKFLNFDILEWWLTLDKSIYLGIILLIIITIYTFTNKYQINCNITKRK